MGYLNQLGIAEQTDYDTQATVTRFYEWDDDSLKVNEGSIPDETLGSQFYKVDLDRIFEDGGEGDINMSFYNTGMGLWLKHIFGQLTVAQVGSTAEYTQTATPATAGTRGKALTVQKGIEDTGGTIRPFTFHGGKILRATFANTIKQNLKLGMGLHFKGANDATAIATASYPTGRFPLSFLDATIELDGDEVCANDITIVIERPLNTDRVCLGNSRREPLPNGKLNVTGTLNLEFESRAQYEAWRAGTISRLVATWASGEIGATGNPFKLVLTLENIKRRGEMPTFSGNDIPRQPVAFQALWDGTNPLIEAVFHTSDTTA